jgi:hypothetical protein
MAAFRNNVILWALTKQFEEGIDLAIALWYSSALTIN